MRCTMTRRDGRPCTMPYDRLVGGIAACKYHIGAATRLWHDVQDHLPENVRLAAERDTRIRNQSRTD